MWNSPARRSQFRHDSLNRRIISTMRTHPLGAFVAIAMVATACGGSTDQALTPPTSAPSSTTSSSTTVSFSLDAEVERFSGLGFAEFLDTSYAALAVRSPQAVTSIGLGDELGIGNGQLDDLSDAFIRQTQELETGRTRNAAKVRPQCTHTR